MRYRGLLLSVIILGIIGFLIFSAYAIIDYAALRQAYVQFERTAHSSGVTDILVAEAKQNVHRINVFAEGVWALLSALIAAVGIHGLCVHSSTSQ